MKKLFFAVKVLFVVSLVAWSIYKFDLAAAKNIFHTANLIWGAAAVSLNIFVFYFVTLRWKLLIKGFCPHSTAKVSDLLSINLLSAFYILFIPTTVAAEVVRVFKLKAHIQNDYKTATLTALLDRVIGISTWFILFMVFPSPFHNNKLWLAVPVGLIAVYFLRKKMVFFGHAVLDFSKHHPLDILKIVLFSFFGQFASAFVMFSVFRCFGTLIPLADAIGITAATAMAAMIPISVLGIGAKEGSLFGILPKYAVSPTQIVIITGFLVFINYVYGLMGGLIELWHSGWKFSKLKLPTDAGKN